MQPVQSQDQFKPIKSGVIQLTTLTVAMMVIQGQMAYAATQDVATDKALPTIVVQAGKKASLAKQVTTASSATKMTMALKDVPQVVNVVPHEVMKDQGVTSMQGALQNVAGLSFSVGDGQRDQVQIRGFSAITDQYVDGVRDDAMYFRDMSNVERVEVLKGPASVLYGRGSAGGLVNRISKKPQAKPVNEVALMGSTLGQHRAEVDLGQNTADNTVKFRLTAAEENSDGWRQQAYIKRQAIAPSLAWDISPQTKLLIQADYLHDRRLADQGMPTDPLTGKPVDTNHKLFYGAANGRQVGAVDSEVSSATINLDHAFSDSFKYHGAVRAYQFSLDRQYSTISHPAKKLDQITFSQGKRIRNEDGIYVQNELSDTFNTGSIKHQALVGVEYSHQNKDEVLWSKTRQTTSLVNPVLSTWAALDTSATPGNNNSNTFENYGVYLQDLISLTTQLKVMAGVRYDNLSQHRDDKTKNNMDLDRTDNSVSPRLGLVYQPVDSLSLYASYNQSFQPLADSFVFYKNSDELKPTQTTSYEAGAKWDITNRLNASLAVFQMTQTNIQNASPTDPTVALLIGEQRTRGVELSMAGEIAPNLDLLAGYAYMDGIINKSTAKTAAGKSFAGNKAALTPSNTVNVWLKQRLNDQWWVALGGRGESARYSAPDNLNRLPGYAVVNAAIGYQQKNYDVTLNLNNLFNRDYFVSGHSGANDSNLPGDPINAQLALRYRF